jgi:hypothetical protein
MTRGAADITAGKLKETRVKLPPLWRRQRRQASAQG